MEMTATKNSARNPIFWNLIYPLAGLAGVLAVDHFYFTGVMLTPAGNFIMMAILALRLKPATMIFWAVAFVASTLFVLMNPDFVMKGRMDFHANVFVRGIGAMTGASLAVFLCIQRGRLIQDHEQMLAVLSKMPVPLVLSDENGDVLFVNLQASALLKVTDEEARGDSFFSLLESTTQKGTAVQRYLAIFDSRKTTEIEDTYRPRKSPGEIFHGQSILVETAGTKRMVTIFSPPPA